MEAYLNPSLNLGTLFNYENTCQVSCTVGLVEVTYQHHLEKYCDASCGALATFLNLLVLFNNEGSCEEECTYGKLRVTYEGTNDKYCDASCHDLQNFFG